MQIQTSAAGVDLQGRAKHHLCVPTVLIEGKSYRMKDQIEA
jgi:hypothetical protein